MTPAELLEELRRECPEAPVTDARGKPPRPDEEWFVTISSTELATLIAKREHAARMAGQERMLRMCRMAVAVDGAATKVLDKVRPLEPWEEL